MAISCAALEISGVSIIINSPEGIYGLALRFLLRKLCLLGVTDHSPKIILFQFF